MIKPKQGLQNHFTLNENLANGFLQLVLPIYDYHFCLVKTVSFCHPQVLILH